MVKFKENGQGIRVLTNEFVTNKLAQFLQVPVPEGVIVEIDEEFLSINPTLNQICGRPISIGKHFATAYLSDAYKNPPGSLIKESVNKAALAGIVLLDILTYNSDRKSEHYLVVKSNSIPEQLYLYGIDHGHCFGQPSWDANITQKVGQWDQSVFSHLSPEMAECAQGALPFEPYLSRLKTLTDNTIAEIIAQIPDEWNVPTNERESLKNFLIGQKDQVEPILLTNKQKFPFWQ